MSGTGTFVNESEKADWLPVSQAAAARGVSERTLRKRIKAGEVEAEKCAQPGGGLAWRVAPENEAQSEAASNSQSATGRKRNGSGSESEVEISGPRAGSEPEADRKPFKHEMATARKRFGNEVESEPEVSVPISDRRTGSGTEAARIAEMREEIIFLRGVVEAQNRDAAETRATMRALVAAQSKALPGGSTQVLVGPENQDQTKPQVLAEDVNAAAEPGEFAAQSDGVPKVTPDSKSGSNSSSKSQRTAWQKMAARILGIR